MADQSTQPTPLNSTESQTEQPEAQDPDAPRKNRWLWQGKIGPTLWTVASVLSLAVNVILIVILILVGRELFALKGLVSNQLIGGLYDNFVLMDDARIQTTIHVQDTIQVNDSLPVVFDLPLAQDTEVVLTRNVPVNNAVVYLNGTPITTNIILKKNTTLNIRLNMTVPVSQTVPVLLNVPIDLTVPVDIPLNQTDLHEPFVGLQNVVAPYDQLLASLPDSWQDTPLCGLATGWLCHWLFGTP